MSAEIRDFPNKTSHVPLARSMDWREIGLLSPNVRRGEERDDVSKYFINVHSVDPFHSVLSVDVFLEE